MSDDNELRTKTGKVLTGADIAALADEAERGYDIHKARPAENHAYRCAVCHQRIKRVPGGHGPVWIHVDTGAVAALGADPADQ